MKPRNFPGNRLRRQARAAHRIPLVRDGPQSAAIARLCPGVFKSMRTRSLEAERLRARLPANYIEQPKDIRIRMGKKARAI